MLTFVIIVDPTNVLRCEDGVEEKVSEFEGEKDKRKSLNDMLDSFMEMISSSEKVLSEMDTSNSPAANALLKIQVFFTALSLLISQNP